MVMPRSRSRSIESSSCGRCLRASTAPVTSRMRSASVDLPWSMWAMIEKFRMWSIGGSAVWRLGAAARRGALALLEAELGQCPAAVDIALEEEELAVVDADDGGGPGLEDDLAGLLVDAPDLVEEHARALAGVDDLLDLDLDPPVLHLHTQFGAPTVGAAKGAVAAHVVGVLVDVGRCGIEVLIEGE